jgi:hypothetical protein
MPDESEELSLLDSLSREWIKLLLPVMREVGPACQTLGGLLKLTKRETFSPVDDIARHARLPMGTVRKHLLTLHDHGWIHNAGRQPTKRGYPRRTATIRVTKKTTVVMDTETAENRDTLVYGFLPWWACCTGKIHLPWSARAVLSVVMARLCGKMAAIKEQEGVCDTDDIEELAGQIDNMDVEDSFRFSLDRLVAYTGLTRESVVMAKRVLNHRHGIVNWLYDHRRQQGTGTPTDMLLPNWDFRVIVTPASEGKCYLTFDKKRGGSENGL